MRRSILAVAAATVFASLAVSGAASAQTRIQPGQTARGQLAASDPRMGDQSAYDCYVLATNAGQTYTVTQRSSAFDTYLAVTPTNDCRATPRTGESNDDGPDMGTNSQIVFQGTGQPWIIRANSYAGDQFGAYTVDVAVSGAAAPSRPVGKPPVGGGSAPPANNNSSGGNAGSFAGISRPTDPQERYTWDTMCSGVDTIALILSSEGMSDEALMAWVEESSVLHNAAVASGRAIGKTEEDVTNDSATFGAAYFQDETLFDDAPPLELRAACLAVVPR